MICAHVIVQMEEDEVHWSFRFWRRQCEMGFMEISGHFNRSKLTTTDVLGRYCGTVCTVFTITSKAELHVAYLGWCERDFHLFQRKRRL